MYSWLDSLYDFKTGKLVKEFSFSGWSEIEEVYDLDGKLVVESSDGVFYDFDTKKPIVKTRGCRPRIIKKINERFLIKSAENSFFDLKTGEKIADFGEKAIGDILNSVNGRIFVRDKYEATFYDLETKEVVQKFPEPVKSEIKKIQGKWFVQTTWPAKGDSFYEFFTGKKVTTLPESVDNVYTVNNKVFVRDSLDKKILYDFWTGKKALEFPRGISSVVNQLNQTHLVRVAGMGVSSDEYKEFYDLETAEKILSFPCEVSEYVRKIDKGFFIFGPCGGVIYSVYDLAERIKKDMVRLNKKLKERGSFYSLSDLAKEIENK